MPLWKVRRWRFCDLCGKKACERGRVLCNSCLAELEQAIEKILGKA